MKNKRPLDFSPSSTLILRNKAESVYKIILQSSPVLIFLFLLKKANILIASLPVNYNCAKKKKVVAPTSLLTECL